MKKQSGSKITSSHTTSLEHCVSFIKHAEKSDKVEKILLGIIRMTPKARGGNRRVKCTEDKACLILNVRANRGLQVLYFYCKTIGDVAYLKSEMLKVAKDTHFAIQN